MQWKPAGRFVPGFIQFTLAGGIERRSEFGSQTSTAAGDENSVLFKRAQQGQFEAVRAAVEAAIAGGAQPASGADVVGQLRDLAALRDQGALTDAEFAAAKSRLLGAAEGCASQDKGEE